MANPKSVSTIRLNKYISDSGVCSRRQADKLIEEGQVAVNGKKVYELGVKIDPREDKVLVDGKPIKTVTMKLYIMLHKPSGVLTTMDDPLDRPTIKQYLDDVPVRVFPVGRLDWDSEGLLLLTNDGEYAQKILHPSAEVTKTYLVKLKKTPSPEHLRKLLRGVSIEGGKVAARFIDKIEKGKGEYPWYKIVITEGKNRQVRQMFEKIGNDVIKLQRVAIGRLRIGALKRGDMVYLNDVAADRVFMPDESVDLKDKKSYKGRAQEYAERAEKRSSGVSKSRKKAPSKAKREKDIFGD